MKHRSAKAKHPLVAAIRKLALVQGAACLPALTVTTGITAISQPAFAQLDEVVVTARKVAESLQDAPVAVTAFTGEDLERFGVTDLRSLTEQTAGLQFDGLPGGFNTAPVIRGVSQVSRLDDENNVSIFIDGVYISGRQGLNSNLLDLERVEVVKGPQSALYGRNSYAGAINYITKKPGEELEGKLVAKAGSDSTYRMQGTVSGPMVDGVLGGRISAVWDTYGGGYSNPINNSDVGGYKTLATQGSLHFTPTDNLNMELVSYYSDDRIDQPASIAIAGNCGNINGLGEQEYYCGIVPDVDSDIKLPYDTRAFGVDRQIWRTSLSAVMTFGDFELTSITGASFLDTDSLLDQDRQYTTGGPLWDLSTFTPAGYAEALPQLISGGDTTIDEYQQQFRLAFSFNDTFSYLAGVSYYDLTNEISVPFGIDFAGDPNGLVPSATAFGLGGVLDIPDGCCSSSSDLGPEAGNFNESISSTETWAVFGAVDYFITDTLTARAELRYTEETKRAVSDVQGFDFKNTFTFWTPRFTLDMDLGDTLLYGAIARGAKAGGFNTSSGTPEESRTYDPEFNWTYEIGAKTYFLDRNMRVNLAVFYIDMEDIQITSPLAPDTPVFYVQNAGTGESIGFELETETRVNDWLTVSANYALADSKFIDAQDFSLRNYPIEGGVDVSGQQLPRTSKHTANLAFEVNKPAFENFDYYARLSGRFESEQKGYTHDTLATIDDRFIVGLRAGVVSEKVDVLFFADNLTGDETPVITAQQLFLSDFTRSANVAAPQPRRYGVTVSYRF